MTIDTKLYKNLVIIKERSSDDGLVFHPQLLDLALLSATDLENLKTDFESPISKELEEWSKETHVNSIYKSKSFSINSISLNVTQICNLKCLYCEAGGDGTYNDPQFRISIEKTFPQIRWLISKKSKGESFRINFLGGEPLLFHEGIFAICKYVNEVSLEKEINSSFSIVTNGTIFNSDIKNLLTDFKFDVTISIDGPTEINDKVRPSKNGKASTEKTIETITELIKLKNKLSSINIHGVFGDKNLSMIEAYKFYSNFNVDSYEFAYDVSSVNKDSNDIFIQNLEEIAQMAWKNNHEAGLRKINFFNKIFRSLDNTEFKHNYCGFGKNYAAIDAKNQIFQCPWYVGQTDKKIGQHEFVNEVDQASYSQSLIELNSCDKCWARYLCGGGCMYINELNTGNKHLKDYNFCKRTQNLISLALLYYKKAREISAQ